MRNVKMGVAGMLVLGLLAVPATCRATIITFTSSGTIQDGDVYEDVYVENDGTVVDMTGGQIGYLWLEDESRFNMSGGYIGPYAIDSHGTSYFDISGGTVELDEIILYGQGGCFSGGNVTVSVRLKTGGTSLVQIEGGILNFDIFDIYGSMDIKGGYLTVNDIWLDQDSTLNIYSENFSYNATSKILMGDLIDGSDFSIGGVDQWEYDSFNFVPEPATLLLFGLGGLFLRRRS